MHTRKQNLINKNCKNLFYKYFELRENTYNLLNGGVAFTPESAIIWRKFLKLGFVPDNSLITFLM